MKVTNTLMFGALGAVSGFLSAVATDTLQHYYQWSDAPWYTAGIMFGIFIAIGILMRRDREATLLFRLPLWIVGSTASYFIAVKTVQLLIEGTNVAPRYGEFLIAGGAGALAMLASFSILLFGLELKELGILVVFGTALGLTWFLGDPASELWYQKQFFTLYVCWQTGMALGLGMALDRRRS
ncbi:MAG: hypothetical protein AAB417_01585 [Patescibacteria group bacterium]